MPDLRQSFEEYRGLREALETSVLPLATSVDGQSFSFQVSLHGLELQTGGYVALETGDGSVRLGQILSLGLHREDATDFERQLEGEAEGGRLRGRLVIRIGRGEGVLLDGDGAPFHDALVRAAAPDEVGAWLERIAPARARLEVGELALAPGVPFALDAGGFGRHTFLCGQSGSGKTYSLGVLLERLLMETGLRVVILDPNSDYVRLGEVLPDAFASDSYTGAAEGVTVRTGADLGMRFRELSPAHQAAVLELDPVRDREEYAELVELVEDRSVRSLADLEGSRADALKLRARNLGVDRWSVWPGEDGASVVDELGPDGPRCLVVDLGSLGTREEQSLVAGAVLERLWRRRAEREPVAIVIDEAHNVCPAAPGDPLTALATADAVRIAGEGRKFGLYLIVVTQRPQKVHENVVSQCDNLVLMRVNSAADLAHIGEVFSFVPPGLIERATGFPQGEALVAGKVASHPTLIRFGSRLSREGGGDVPADWA
jgi:DNA helicase HerA-like ATPase